MKDDVAQALIRELKEDIAEIKNDLKEVKGTLGNLKVSVAKVSAAMVIAMTFGIEWVKKKLSA